MPEYFFGTMTNPTVPYSPWYNTIAWLALATPAPVFVLGLIGLAGIVRAWRDLTSTSLVFHWLILMIVRALPGAPAYDGIRLFLPAFGFWCLLAAVGVSRAYDWSWLPPRAWQRGVAGTVLAIAIASGGISIVRYFPQTLSHYSLLVGGVRGAARLGLDPTYWWDALDDDALTWINAHTSTNGAVAFSSSLIENAPLLHRWGRLRPEMADPAWGLPFEWYVVQNRPGTLKPVDRTLIDTQTPEYQTYAGGHRDHMPLDLDVPLLWVFSSDQYARAVGTGDRGMPQASPPR
jgi:hypothetical protein